MEHIDISAAKSNLDFKIHLFYFWIIFGIFLILWRVYYYWINYSIRLWVTILWFGIAAWLIGYGLVAIPFYSKLHKSILGLKYKIIENGFYIFMLNNKINNIYWEEIRVIHLNESPKILATAIFFIDHGKLRQVWVDADAGVDIAYHCLKWYMDRDEMPKCVIVRDLRTAYKVLKQLVPRRLDPIAELKPAKKIDEERFLKYIRENFWLDKKTIEMELKRLEKEMNKENLK